MPDHLICFQPKGGGPVVVDVLHATLDAENKDHILRRFGQGAVSSFTVAQRVLRLQTGRDVLRDDQDGLSSSKYQAVRGDFDIYHSTVFECVSPRARLLKQGPV